MDEERRGGGSGGGNGGGEGGGEQGRLEAGAGLQESRLNQDFIAWLEKWGPRVLYVVLAVVVVYVGLQWWGRYQEQQTDRAFSELQAAIDAGDPAVLSSVAEEYSDRAAVSDLARLELGRMFVIAGTTRRAIVVGEAEEGVEPEMLTDEQAEARLREGLRQFEMVLGRSREAKPLIAQQARWWMATAQMSLGELEVAEATLSEFVSSAERLGNAGAQRSVAESRLALLEGGAERLSLPERGSLPDSMVAPERPSEGGGAGAALEFGTPGAGGGSPGGGMGEADPVFDPFAGWGIGVGGGSGGSDGEGGDDGDGDGGSEDGADGGGADAASGSGGGGG